LWPMASQTISSHSVVCCFLSSSLFWVVRLTLQVQLFLFVCVFLGCCV
jgi:hypothetical protein